MDADWIPILTPSPAKGGGRESGTALPPWRTCAVSLAVITGLVAFWQFNQQWRIENERYFWYVSLMSQAFEEVFAHVPEVDAWVAIAEIQIAFHCGFYLGDDYDPSLYSARFRGTVDRIIDEDPLGVCH